MLGIQLQVGERKHVIRDRRFARGRKHEDMHAIYLAGSVSNTYVCDAGFKIVSRILNSSIKIMTRASSSLHIWCKFALWSVGSGLLSARSALAIVFGANLGAVSGAKIVLIHIIGGPERALILWFHIAAAFEIVLPNEGGSHFLLKVCNFEKTRVCKAVKI